MTRAVARGRSAGARRVEVTALAKLNLGLAVGPLRADGFHELATVFQSVSLADTLIAERTRSGFSLRVRFEDAALRGRSPRPPASDVPAGGANLVLRAARLASASLGLRGGARFTLVKRIPARAGLGGGSADAAAALAAVVALHGHRPPRARLLALATELGADVPFALTGGTAVGLGRGERLVPVRLAAPFRALLAVPGWRVATPDAFRRVDRFRKGLTAWEQRVRFAATLGRERVTATMASRLGNTFEEVLGRHRHDFERLRARMREAGLEGPRLTGSGSGVFGIVPNGVPVREIAGRFSGDEPLYELRSRVCGLRLRVMT